MNEQLAAENAALVAELAKLQHRQHRQTASLAPRGPLFQSVETVAGIPVDELASLLAPPGTTASGKQSCVLELMTSKKYVGKIAACLADHRLCSPLCLSSSCKGNQASETQIHQIHNIIAHYSMFWVTHATPFLITACFGRTTSLKHLSSLVVYGAQQQIMQASAALCCRIWCQRWIETAPACSCGAKSRAAAALR